MALAAFRNQTLLLSCSELSASEQRILLAQPKARINGRPKDKIEMDPEGYRDVT